MKKIPWLCMMLLLGGATVAHGQQWPVYNYGSYQGYPQSQAQGYPQTQAPRYYNYPYGYGAYYTGNAMPAARYPYASQYGSPYGYSPYYATSRSGSGYPYYSTPAPTYYSTQAPAYSSPAVTASPPTSSGTEPYYSSGAVIAPAPGSMVVASNEPPASPNEQKSDKRTTLWQALGLPSSPANISGEERPPVPFHRPCKDVCWISAEYLASFITPMRLAGPLVTTAAIPDTGAIGQPTTNVLFGNRPVDFNMFSGINLMAGVFLDEKNRYSLEWSGFVLFPVTQTYSIASDAMGNPLIARPVFATDLGREAVFQNSTPGSLAGNISIESKSLLAGTEFNIRMHTYGYENLHADGLFGLRYLRLAESLRIQENINSFNGANPVTFNGSSFNMYSDTDSFATTNQFFGVQLGGRVAWENTWFQASAFGKLGIGATVEHVDINGSTTFISPAGNQTAVGGVLALPSNIGRYSRTVFGVVPEMGINFDLNVTDHLRLRLGTSALFWNKVVRPGMQYDRDVNTGLAPTGNFGMVTGPIAPLFRFNDEFFWKQSFNVGVEYHF